jgi:hypothetical protein
MTKKEAKEIKSVFTDITEAYETVNWLTGLNKVSFKNADIEIDNDFWEIFRHFETE